MKLTKAKADAITHLLLIGPTKAGKTHYAAQAAKDGYTVLYLDSDHGLNTLLHVLKDDLAAQKRVNFVRVNSPAKFWREFILTGKVRVIEETGQLATSAALMQDSDAIITEIDASKIPKGVIVVLDSWTSLSNAALKEAAVDAGKDLTKSSAADLRSVYSSAGSLCTAIAMVLQAFPFHVVVIAHPRLYEITTRPTGKGKVKEEELKRVKTVEVPQSTSKPHGYTIGKYFTDIGWAEIDRAGRSTIDFTRDELRVSGGVANTKGTASAMSFKNTFGEPIAYTEEEVRVWLRSESITEFRARRSAKPKLQTGNLALNQKKGITK